MTVPAGHYTSIQTKIDVSININLLIAKALFAFRNITIIHSKRCDTFQAILLKKKAKFIRIEEAHNRIFLNILLLILKKEYSKIVFVVR